MNNRCYFVVVISLVLIVTIFSYCNKNDNVAEEFINTFNLDIDSDKLKISTIYNDYGGVPYEGQALYKLEGIEEIELENEDWLELPLTAELSEFLYKDNDGVSVAKKINFPEIEEGKWCFVDRGKTDFTNPSAYNFSLCLYDEVNNIFYYYKIDT
ncbi:hypothetical protein CLTEP_14670 [Clostridium tepidiprofundi DSM 19306]|uniref:Uncharacterized protein n=1 Tax=Clostridium tepidiprofundi DSM 19306 TaxID=1121338 RepID=A0A151B3N9_9CLOT|nr:hypothetical protein [Clostridium tepidiprofundi]KYH34539.1 hypothetical protein CLTEP_14670 [Clostridium tepidiprofundi DSM 19306]